MKKSRRSPNNIWERFSSSLGKRLHDSLLNEMLAGGALYPRLTFSRFMGFVIALLVYVFALFLLGAGIWLTVYNWGNVVAVFVGIVLLGFAYLSFPRFPKIERPILQRTDFPALYEISDLVSQKLNARSVDGIVISEYFNASFMRVGWRQKRILHIGLPLFISLDDREKIALIAHEIAHEVNKDPTRNFFIQSALYALVNWYDALYPLQLVSSGSARGVMFFIVWISSVFTNVIMIGLSGIAWLGIYALSHLLWRESQRAEYLADYLSTQVGGTVYSISVLNKLRHARKLKRVVGSVVLNYKNPMDADVFEKLKGEIDADSVNREEQEENSFIYNFQMGLTHPPTLYRLRFLQSLPISSPKISIHPTTVDKLNVELSQLKPKVQEKLVDLYESYISQGSPRFFNE